MTIDEIVGYFTYRSFRNLATGLPNDLLFGEGELLLLISDEGVVSGTLAFPSDAGAAEKDLMDISGAVTAGESPTFHFVGKGRTGTSIADFEYEYDCVVAHEWDTATPPQRPTLVGTVRRNKDHGTAKAGVTASFMAVKRDFVEPRTIPGVGLIPEAVQMLSERTHRLRHTVWHTLRGDWFSPKMTSEDREKLRALGWYLDDPPFTASGVLDLTNGAGEDFLYMHRRMIGMLNEVYDRAGQPHPSTWRQLPRASAPQYAYKEEADPTNLAVIRLVLDPANSGFMVHPPTAEFMGQVGGIAFLRFNKTARGFGNLMQNVAGSLRNPRVMCALSLSALGNLIEFTVHNWMHMRWATLSRNPATGTLEVREGYDVDSKWDAPQNDYLGDFHSSHVNPIFWKLHGWVNDCVDAWFAAHEASHPGQIKQKEVRGIDWFEPGPWVMKADPFDWPGASSSHSNEGHGGHTHNDELAVLEQVMALLKEVDDRTTPALLSTSPPAARRRLPGFARFLDANAEF